MREILKFQVNLNYWFLFCCSHSGRPCSATDVSNFILAEQISIVHRDETSAVPCRARTAQTGTTGIPGSNNAVHFSNLVENIDHTKNRIDRNRSLSSIALFSVWPLSFLTWAMKIYNNTVQYNVLETKVSAAGEYFPRARNHKPEPPPPSIKRRTRKRHSTLMEGGT